MRYLPLLFCACIQPLPSAYVVNDLRVLAMIAEPPEAAPGDTVSMTVYLSGAQGSSVNVAISHCPMRALYACDNPEQEESGAAQEISPGIFRYTASHTLGPMLMDEVVLVRGDDGKSPIDAFKRVVVSDGRLPRNRNPVLSGILTLTIDGRQVTELSKGTAYRALAQFMPESIETYTRVYYDGHTEPAGEEAIITWSCTPDCTIDRVNTYDFQTMRVTPTADSLVLYAVLRDTRGGEAFTLLYANVSTATQQ